MSYYWTTLQELGNNVKIREGGHYEALDRKTGKLKTGVNRTVPSSDVPELCVSESPQASLFAKIQSTRKAGVYHIYQTYENPDIKPSRSALDFSLLEEYRYNMNKRDSIRLDKMKSVSVNDIVVKDIEFAYEYSSHNSVNEIFAEKIKKNLTNLIYNSSYPQDLRKQEKERRFKELSEAYGEDYARDVLDYNLE